MNQPAPEHSPGYAEPGQGVRGYRQLTPDQIKLINAVKLVEEDVARMWGQVERVNDVDPHWMRVGRQHIQEGFTAVVRAITKPYDPFQVAFTNNQQDEAEQIIPRRVKPAPGMWDPDHFESYP